MKKYLFVTVTKKNGDKYANELKLSEVNLINSILRNEEAESLKVELTECTKEYYKSLFG